MTGDLQRLADRVAAETGIRITPERLRAVAGAVRSLAGEEGAPGLMRAAGVPVLLRRLVDAVTVRETFFLRDVQQLRAVDWRESLAGARQAGSEVVRVWSAGCASGEEPYSVVLAAAEVLGTPPPVRVLGTDISDAAIEEARRGRYGLRSVRAIPGPLLEREFERHGATYSVGDGVRRCVRFQRHNVARDEPPGAGAFDVVLCRNVLMYLEAAAVERAVATLRQGLAPGGRLIFGAVDRLCLGQAPGPDPERHRDHRRADRRHTRPRTPEGRLRPGPRRGQDARQALDRAMRLADRGRLAEALDALRSRDADSAVEPAARFLEGTLHLACGDAQAAVAALRAALYDDPGFALAAFQLGRAHDALEEPQAARRAYERALRTIDASDTRHEAFLGALDVADVVRACEARLQGSV